MAVTRLKRKHKRNKLVAKQRQVRLKHLLARPALRKVATTAPEAEA